MVPGDLSGSCVFTICSLFLLRLYVYLQWLSGADGSISQPHWDEVLLLLSALSTGLVLVLWQS